MAGRMSASFLLFLLLSSSALTGCDQIDPKVPTEKLLADTLVGYSKKHGGVYEFQNIKKLDGQLQSDGLHYVMEYQATLKTNSCFSMYYDSLSDFLDFTKPINKSPFGQLCAADRVLAYQNQGAILINGLQSQFLSKGVFTKKESGWQLQDAGVSWQVLGGR